mmetsp:Transcript_107341/g.303561  ORF Transcript_107341/g.303561 Transcript_107341/m.303561 type:complete len:211 (-) Transcript_107341:1134-1766(-)
MQDLLSRPRVARPAQYERHPHDHRRVLAQHRLSGQPQLLAGVPHQPALALCEHSGHGGLLLLEPLGAPVPRWLVQGDVAAGVDRPQGLCAPSLADGPLGAVPGQGPRHVPCLQPQHRPVVQRLPLEGRPRGAGARLPGHRPHGGLRPRISRAHGLGSGQRHRPRPRPRWPQGGPAHPWPRVLCRHLQGGRLQPKRVPLVAAAGQDAAVYS